MSLKALFPGLASQLLGRNWGAQIEDKDGKVHDTGVQKLAETIAAALTDQKPVEIDRPIEIINKSGGPAIRILDASGSNQGLEVFNRDGQSSTVGIGLGNQGLVANNLVPVPEFEISPFALNAFSPIAPGGLGQYGLPAGAMNNAATFGGGGVTPVGQVNNPFSFLSAQNSSPLYGASGGPWTQGSGLGGFTNIGGFNYQLSQFDPQAANFDSLYGSGLTVTRPPTGRFNPAPLTNPGGVPTTGGPYGFPWLTGDNPPPVQPVTGTATGGTLSTLTGTGFLPDWPDGGSVVGITGGTGSGQWRRIEGATDTTLSVSPPWDTAPDSTSGYAVYPGVGTPGAVVSGTATGGTTTTLSGAGFYPAWPNQSAVVGILDGTGVGQWRPITSVSGGTLSVNPPWDLAPDSTSDYVIRTGVNRGGTQVGWSPDGSPLTQNTLDPRAPNRDLPGQTTGAYGGYPGYGTRPPGGNLAGHSGFPLDGYVPDFRVDNSGGAYPVNGGTPQFPRPASMLPPFVQPDPPPIPGVADPAPFPPNGYGPQGVDPQVNGNFLNDQYGSTPSHYPFPDRLRPQVGPPAGGTPRPNGYGLPGSGTGVPGNFAVQRPTGGMVSNVSNFFSPFSMGLYGPTPATIVGIGDNTLTVQPEGWQNYVNVSRPPALQNQNYDETTNGNTSYRSVAENDNRRHAFDLVNGTYNAQFISPGYQIGQVIWIQYFPRMNTFFNQNINFNINQFTTEMFFLDLNFETRIFITYTGGCEEEGEGEEEEVVDDGGDDTGIPASGEFYQTDEEHEDGYNEPLFDEDNEFFLLY